MTKRKEKKLSDKESEKKNTIDKERVRKNPTDTVKQKTTDRGRE